MAFDLIQILIASGIGAGAGLISGLIAIAIGKKRLDNKAEKIASNTSFISSLSGLVLGKFGEKLFEKNKECEFCHKELPEVAIFCSYCGKLAKGPMNCPNCNHSLPDKSEFWHAKFSSE